MESKGMQRDRERKRKRKRPGFWNDLENQREAIDAVKDRLSIDSARDWKRVSVTKVIEHGGETVLSRYNKSVYRMLRTLYPEDFADVSEEECRPHVGRGYWDNVANQRAFFKRFAAVHSIDDTSADGWRAVKAEDFALMGGSALLTRYASFRDALTAAYPEFGRAERDVLEHGHWNVPENRRAFLERLRRELRISAPEDWLRVSERQVRNAGGRGLLHTTTLLGALQDCFPEEYGYAVKKEKESRRGESLKASQRMLCLRLSEIIALPVE